MENIFENAYFGKPYRTRDGKKVRYCGKQNSMFEIELDGNVIDYFPDGYFFMVGESQLDIVSEWQEPINEEELDKLAKESYPYEDGVEEAHWNLNQYRLRKAYKAGYRKAKEE